MKKTILIVVVVSFTHWMVAQRSLTEGAFENGRWSIAAEAGFGLWDGDFHPTRKQMLVGFVTSPLLGVSMEYNMSPFLSAGMMFGGYFYNQEDADESVYSRGVYFAPYLSTDILGFLNGEKFEKWSLWASVGVGTKNPIRSYYSRTGSGAYNVRNRVVPPGAVLLIPLSLNLERRVSQSMSIGLMARFNVTNSDVMDGVFRGDFNDHSESLALTARYRILPESKQHFRDRKFEYQSPAIKAIIENIQKIEVLEQQVDSLQNRLQSAEEKLLKIEKSK